MRFFARIWLISLLVWAPVRCAVAAEPHFKEVGRWPDWQYPECWAVGVSGPTHVCREPGCGKGTSEQKPYCFDHLARMPAVAAILRRTGVAGREERKSAAMRAKEEAAKRPCPACGGPMPPPKSMGRARRYCSRRCAQNAWTRARTLAPRPVAPTGDHSALDTAAIRAALEHLNTGLRLLADALATKGA